MQDCCCSIVADLREALADPHFRARGLFEHVLTNEKGDALPALPLAISPAAAPIWFCVTRPLRLSCSEVADWS